MNILSWMLALGFLVSVLSQGITFHKATVCRQEAWLISTELITGSLLSNPKPLERDFHLGCRISFLREQTKVFWQRFPHLKRHHFELNLSGTL